MTRFAAKLEEPLIMRSTFVEVTMSIKPSSLGKAMRLVLFTGAGKLPPRAFSIRIASRAIPGMVCTGWLQKLEVAGEGGSTVVLRLEKAEYKILNGLMNKMVAVEVIDERPTEE
jgi:hypothetical protein